jgi:hypothetical protein
MVSGRSRLVFAIDVGERLSVVDPDDEALPLKLGIGVLDRPGRREAAGGHGVDHLLVERRSSFTTRMP